MIGKPKKRIAPEMALKTLDTGRGRLSPIADLNVTAMVDMLTMLVIFLLMTFSATGEILFISKEISLPKAYHAGSLERAPVIAISAQSLALEGEGVMETSGASSKLYPDWKLPPLYSRLEAYKKAWQQRHPDETFKGDVIIQSDENVRFDVIKMVMFTCAQVGYFNVNFAVQKGSQSQVGAGS